MPVNHRWTVHYDPRGQAYYTLADATEVMKTLSLAPSMPAYRVDTSCGPKAKLSACNMALIGVEPTAIGMAFNLIPDQSPEGVELAYRSETQIMHSQSPYRGISHAERLRATNEKNELSRITEIDGIRLEPFEKGGINLIGTDGHKIWVGDVGYHYKYDHHVAPTLRVLNPTTNQIEPMIIDMEFFDDKPYPLTLNEWKDGQYYSGSVVIGSTIDQPFRIRPETLDYSAYKRLCGELNAAPESSPQQLLEIIESLPPEQHNKLMSDFFNLTPESRLIPTLMNQEPMLPFHSRSSLQSIRDAAESFAATLRPVVIYQQWREHANKAYGSNCVQNILDRLTDTNGRSPNFADSISLKRSQLNESLEKG